MYARCLSLSFKLSLVISYTELVEKGFDIVSVQVSESGLTDVFGASTYIAISVSILLVSALFVVLVYKVYFCS